MTTIVIEANEGSITVSVDGGAPQQVQDAEGACQIIESTLGQPDQDDGAEAMMGGYQGVRGNGM